MPRISVETRKRVCVLRESGLSLGKIRKRLSEEQIVVSRVALHKLWRKYKETATIVDMPRRRPTPKLSREQLRFIDDSMASNDELTSRKLREMLEDRWPDVKVSLSTVKRARRHLGWIATTPKYCQLIREGNKEKRLLWCKKMIETNEQFSDVVWTDECSVQLDNHGRLCFRRKGEPRKLKPRAKHPIKVHIWGGISFRGATPIVIFTGTMTATRYCAILEAGLLPFLKEVFSDTHRFQQDNDPKHTSRFAKEFLAENAVNWWKTPAESPDLNPIENVWASLKYYLRHTYKPRNMETLVDGIKMFWRSLTPALCQRYIRHLHKVIPRAIQVNGAASGY